MVKTISALSRRQRTLLRCTLTHRLKSTFVLPAIGAGLFIASAALPSMAADYVVGTGQGQYASLGAAITALNQSTDTTNTISFDSSALTNNVYTFQQGDAFLPMVTKSVTINGVGVTLNANNNRAFIVGDGTNSIDVNFNGLTIENALAKGGDGGDGNGVGGGGAGGGGAGLGGAIFVNENAHVTLNSVGFMGNQANGGNSNANVNGHFGGGGGGALNGGNGGNTNLGSGGGGGLQGNGTSSGTIDGGDGGDPNGGGGGGHGNATGGDGGDSTYGGGGGGGEGDSVGGGNATGGDGGDSVYGGGGGGGGGSENYGIGEGNATGGDGGDSTYGGGGGGGGAGFSDSPDSTGKGGKGGNGGFGGGGGSGADSFGVGNGFIGAVGSGGFGGGDGGSGGNKGGGGAGFGGAVFVRNGGSLTITGDTTIEGNSVAGGTGVNPGQAAGSGLYLDGINATFNIDQDESTSINDDITDGYEDSDGVHQLYTDSGSNTHKGSITKTGDGTLVLDGENAYSGDTNINGGTLQNDNMLTNSNITAYTGGTFVNKGTVGKDVTADGGDVENDRMVNGTGSAINGGTFNNNTFGSVANGAADGDGSTFNNYSIVNNDAEANGGTFNNYSSVKNNASVTDGGTFNNIVNVDNSGIVEGNVTISGDGSTFNNASVILGGVEVNGGTFNGIGGSVFGNIALTNTGAGNVGEVSIAGDGPNANPPGTNGAIDHIVEVGARGGSAAGVSNAGSNAFTIGGGSIGANGATANGNIVTNKLDYQGVGNYVVENSGSGDFTVGNGTIYGSNNTVNNSVTEGDSNGNIHQTGNGNTVVGGMDIHGDNNTVTATVGNIIATNGKVYGEFNSLHSSGNISETNLGKQDLSGSAEGHYGDGDVFLAPFSDNNKDTITLNGIDIDGATVNIGGGTHTVSGNDNKYSVVVNPDISTDPGNTTAISATNNATVNISNGSNSFTGDRNIFGNFINGDIALSGNSLLDLAGRYGHGVSGSNDTINSITGNVTADDSTILVTGVDNIIQGGVTLAGQSELNIMAFAVGGGLFPSVDQDNSLNANVHFTDNDGTAITIGGVLGNFGGNNAVNDALYGNVTGDVGVGGNVTLGTGVTTSSFTSDEAFISTANSTLQGTVKLDGTSSEVFVGDNGIYAGLGESGDNANTINGVNNTITGAVTLSNGGNIDLGRSAAYEANLGVASITVNDGTGSSSVNTINNNIQGKVDVTNGNVNFNGGSFDISSDASTNIISNTIAGKITMHGTGTLSFAGDFNISDDTGNVSNKVINTAQSGVELDDNVNGIVKGTNNYIVFGLTLNDSATQTVGGGSDATSGDVFNQLNVSDAGVVLNANPAQQQTGTTYTPDSPHLIIGAYGGTNTNIADGHSIINLLVGDVTSNGGTGTDGNPNGGLIVLGGAGSQAQAGNQLLNGATITNQIIGSVALNGGSRMYFGGDSVDANSDDGTINNIVSGTIALHGDSLLGMYGNNDADDHDAVVANSVVNGVTADGNSFFRIAGNHNTIGGGVALSGNATAQIAALTHGDQGYQNDIATSFTLSDGSHLILGSDPFNPTAAPNSTLLGNNKIDGDVVFDGASTGGIEVLSGGSGGLNSAAGLNEITGDLTLRSGNHFDTYVNGQEATGVAVDGTVALNGAMVQVHGIAGNIAFGHRNTLVQAQGTGSVTSGFGAAQIYDWSAVPLVVPALKLTPGYDATSAYLDWETDFQGLARTANQYNFGQYLDNLVANAGPNGIVDDPNRNNDLSDLLNLLALQPNADTYNNFLGDSYSAFDTAGYWNANRFVNVITTHARQSHDNDWTEAFALNAQNGLAGIGAQTSLVKQLLNARPSLRLAANGNSDYGNGSSLWGSISGDRLRNDGDAHLGSPQWSQTSKNVAIGYQGGSNAFSWGITGGYHDGDVNFDDRAADGDIDGWDAGLNALWQNANHIYVNGVLSYSHNSDDLTRRDGIGANSADFNTNSLAGLLEIGKRINRKTYNFTPYASLLGVRYKRDGIQENGTGAGLDIDSASRNYVTSALGVRIGHDYLDAQGNRRGGMMLGVNWQHQFGDTDIPVRASLQGTSGSFTTYGTPLSGNTVGVELGGYARLTSNFYGFLNYHGNFGSNQKVNSITAGVGYEF